MKVQEILISRGIDLQKTKLMRHSESDEMASQSLALGYFDIYQAIQSMNRLKGCDHFLSFLGMDGTSGKYYGCYKITGYVPLTRDLLPLDFPIGDFTAVAAKNEFLKIEKIDILCDMENRLVIDWGKSTRSWIQNATTEKEVLSILPAVSEFEFISYDRVLLHYEALRYIVNNSKEHKLWEEKLSAVAGIYLITDTKTGKHYVGSASSTDDGIWGRWSNYARTKHGGNKRLIGLINNDADYCNNFLFSILEVFPIKRDRGEILEYEQLYKRKLCTIRFGLNDN